MESLHVALVVLELVLAWSSQGFTSLRLLSVEMKGVHPHAQLDSRLFNIRIQVY